MIVLPILLFAILLPISASAGELKTFTSDGCSVFPDGTVEQKNLWLQCCIEHDKAYWIGGTYAQRKEADKTLKQCVTNIGEPEVAQLMLVGVRVGGTPYLPTTFAGAMVGPTHGAIKHYRRRSWQK